MGRAPWEEGEGGGGTAEDEAESSRSGIWVILTLLLPLKSVELSAPKPPPPPRGLPTPLELGGRRESGGGAPRCTFVAEGRLAPKPEGASPPCTLIRGLLGAPPAPTPAADINVSGFTWGLGSCALWLLPAAARIPPLS